MPGKRPIKTGRRTLFVIGMSGSDVQVEKLQLSSTDSDFIENNYGKFEEYVDSCVEDQLCELPQFTSTLVLTVDEAHALIQELQPYLI